MAGKAPVEGEGSERILSLYHAKGLITMLTYALTMSERESQNQIQNLKAKVVGIWLGGRISFDLYEQFLGQLDAIDEQLEMWESV